MARKSPIEIKELGKSGIFDETRFFRLLSEQCNYIAPETAKDFYMGLVRHITKELREKGVIRLPHLGDFALVKQKPRMGWAGKVQKVLDSTYVIKFFVKSSWRKYFSEIERRPGLEGKLDPREKILNRTLV